MSSPSHSNASPDVVLDNNIAVSSSATGIENRHHDDVDESVLQKTHRHCTFAALRHGQSLANCAGIVASDPAVACVRYGLSPLGHAQATRAGHAIVQWFLDRNAVTKTSNNNTDDANEQQSESSATTTSKQHQQQQPSPKYQGLAILSSDFLRAKETAQAVYAAVTQHNQQQQQKQQNCVSTNDIDASTSNNGIPIFRNGVIFDERLRERNFGATYEGQPDAASYAAVWAADAVDATLPGVESVAAVRLRVARCVVDWDKRLRQLAPVEEGPDDATLPATTASASARSTTKDYSCATTPCVAAAPFLVILVAHGDVLQILQTAVEGKPGSQHRTGIAHLETATLRILQSQNKTTNRTVRKIITAPSNCCRGRKLHMAVQWHFINRALLVVSTMKSLQDSY